MPTYEYFCEACENRFEEFQSMKEAPLKNCPKCKSRRLKRLIGSGAGFVFKGAGFYATDYRSEGYKRSKATEEKPKDKEKKTRPGTSPKKTE